MYGHTMKICEHCGCLILSGQYHVRKQLTDTKWTCYTVTGSLSDSNEIERQLQQARSDRGEPSTAL